ncbi:MAG: envelope stress response membrane protein PspB [Rhodospirillaceae bacterium]|nr:envelope stress response membrane protein PspB [Rhodospirillaceae bacterium]
MDTTKVAIEFFGVIKLATIFAFVLGVIWMSRHFKSRKSEAKLLSEEERQTLDDLARIAGKLEDRVATLEKILDADHPNWRDRAA